MTSGRRRRARALPFVLGLICVLQGCATPSWNPRAVEAFAAGHGMERIEVTGTRFRHAIHARGNPIDASRIHVYLEGDGRPWETRDRIAADPTPRNPVALRLMARDPRPAIHVGRPCYHGFSTASGCSPWFWTQGRYGTEVTASMAAAIERLLPRQANRRITLIGYSGGGVLAMLMAERLAGVDRVISIAANLDIDAWTDHHGYSRLGGSLNPASRRPLDARIDQIHLVGGRDGQVPQSSLGAFLARNPQARIQVFPDFDHRCCWVEHWPAILADIERTLGAKPATP
ncbi:alpha/beta fold hydrolase [Thiocystis violascens]|uniref:Alpha/beta hydrolase n=1 Tax=Thiocystis violascens (strain ATCC 17096 / DSM 198 / 6111) TaxID=765911 RepID=I3YH61_THIV6|nr:alpha/beta hydrolase [Thiocystis violascens]AFL76329.1 hypothetical protein Thivi_4534 [Thiocystis violascens DSM 198]